MALSLVLILLVALLLHWPYRWDCRWDAHGRESGVIYSVLYRYEYGPTHDRVTYMGLRRVQIWLLVLLATLVSRFQPELIAWIVETVRHLLGW